MWSASSQSATLLGPPAIRGHRLSWSGQEEDGGRKSDGVLCRGVVGLRVR